MNKKHNSCEFSRPSHYPILLASKMQIPSMQPYIVHRQRLMEKLNQETKAKLTCVTAPAGFGKTTAVGEWLRLNGLPAGWVSLDSADNNPIRFWDYLLSALNHVLPGIVDQILPVLYSEFPPELEIVATQLIDYLYSFSEDFALILDDFHVIQDSSIFESLVFLIQHAPENMHIVIISRTAPPLYLPQLRAKGRLTEIKTGDLRFTMDEAAAYYNNLDLTLNFEELKLLESRTEGWAVGMHLASLLIKKKRDIPSFLNVFRGDSREISTYLSEEVFIFWPEEIRDFLLV